MSIECVTQTLLKTTANEFGVNAAIIQASELIMSMESEKESLEADIKRLISERNAALNELSEWSRRTGLLEAKNDRLQEALSDAYNSRYALCINGDPDDPPTDPLTYDERLQKWSALITDKEAVG